MANQTASNYGVIPVREVQIGTNYMHATMVTTISASASDNLYMVQIPPDCFIVDARIKGSVPSGTTGNIVLKIGTPASDSNIGTFTLSGTAVLNTSIFPNLTSALTISSSGTDAFTPIIIAVNSAATSTTSISLYIQIRYVEPGILD